MTRESREEQAFVDKWDYLGPRHLVSSVARVYGRMESDGEKPGSAKWEIDSRKYRPMLIDRIREEWAVLAEKCDYEFPFHDDAVVRVWIAFRKSTEGGKRLWRSCSDYWPI